MEEQFIQDAISHYSRLQRVLHDLKYTTWQYQDDDVLNQEFNFSARDCSDVQVGGRIDVLATFNGSTRVVIVEVKSVASAADIPQLSWYLANFPKSAKSCGTQFNSIDPDHVIGILLAHQFLPGSYDTNGQKIHLVGFQFHGREFPFRVPPEIPASHGEDAATPVFKHSYLTTVNKHKEWLCSTLHSAFDELCNLCLPPGDPRRSWILMNPQGDHIAIHYKGIYVLHLFVRKHWFYVGYDLPNKQNIRERISLAEGNQDDVLAEARRNLPLVLQAIDDQDVQRGIPADFTWADFDDNRG